MPFRYSQYLNAAAVRHRSVSYNALTPIVDGKGQKPSRISLNFNQAIELLAPYCGLRIVEQLKAVVNINLKRFIYGAGKVIANETFSTSYDIHYDNLSSIYYSTPKY